MVKAIKNMGGLYWLPVLMIDMATSDQPKNQL
jgi:hypothetical protein